MLVQSDLLRLPLILAALVPAIYMVSAVLVTRRSPFGAASTITFVTAGLSVAAVISHGVLTFFFGNAGAEENRALTRGLVQLDLVSCPMLLLVGTLAVVVVRYSRRYLDRETGLVRYVRSLLLTLAAVTLLVISNHLGVLIAGWVATSIGLHQLLTFFPKRRQAVIVAHKTFLLGQISNMCFIATLWLVDHEVGSLHIDVLNTYAQTRGSLPPPLHLALLLLVIGVLLKTAQIPFHGWILQVMEAPTPVSALLHAGVVNIGGFIMIRLAPLMQQADLPQHILVCVGMFTAIIGSLAMTTRPSVKVVLAWSTIGQMGFMLVQCGLGVWQLALLHLLAHSLYKAHAFLSAGAVVETWRGASLIRPARPTLGSIAAGLAVVAIVSAPICTVILVGGWHVSTAHWTFSLALALSFVPMVSKALKAGRLALRLVALFTFAAAVSYFAWHALLDEVAASLHGHASPFSWFVVIGGLILLFVLQTILQTNPTGALAKFLRPHLHDGLYIDDWFTRLTFRLWPPRLERPTSSSRRSSMTLETR